MIKKIVIGALDGPAYRARETRGARLIDRVNRAIDRANGGPNFSSAIDVMLPLRNSYNLRKTIIAALPDPFADTEGITA
jgi:hypothetical protein